MTSRSGVVRAACRGVVAGAALAAALAAECESVPPPGDKATAPAPLADCHVAGIRQGVLCGTLQRPLDPAAPAGAQIAIRYVVVAAMARRKFADPVFLLAGGPGQSAVSVAAATMPLFSRLNNRRDIVFVDQRGTGGSAPLSCQDPEHETLSEQADPERQVRLAVQCKAELLKLPYLRGEGDLRFFTTSIAVQDLDAVRSALGAEQIDLVGASYGTRVALEYQRQFPKSVRRSVLDGAVPPDMVLPASFSEDNQAALDALLAACAAEAACAREHPELRAQVAALLASLPRTIKAAHPLTGRSEEFVLSRDMLLGALRNALYAPQLAAALPAAIDMAAHGDFAGLVGLNATFTSRKAMRIATGMHLSVVCAEDVPRLRLAGDRPGAEFGTEFARFYERLCAVWPRGEVPAGFYTMTTSAVPVLVLSGGIDPATPPRHGERVVRALGPMARHVVVANAGHGVLAIGCTRDVLFRFIDATSDGDALAVDAKCAASVPRPPAFRPLGAELTAASGVLR
ncbi:MAG TPA: alpha/beta fold hydrolase [Caldimonas sp.]|jgi:pimeloyl-ACP methyl ester carboxylesterase